MKSRRKKGLGRLINHMCYLCDPVNFHSPRPTSLKILFPNDDDDDDTKEREREKKNYVL